MEQTRMKESDFNWTFKALGSAIIGTVIAAMGTIDPVPTVYGISIPFIFTIIFAVVGVISILLEIAQIPVDGYIIGPILIFFACIIEFGSPEFILSLIPIFVIADVILFIITIITSKFNF